MVETPKKILFFQGIGCRVTFSKNFLGSGGVGGRSINRCLRLRCSEYMIRYVETQTKRPDLHFALIYILILSFWQKF